MTERREKPLVVKVGGSLAESGRLADILDILVRATRRLVVVPGGGPFADAVRELQPELGLSDEAAHRMAILAMHAMGEAMASLQPRFVRAETLTAMRRAWRAKLTPVWLPARMAGRDPQIPRDWSITSDGLAARLAERLGSVPVVLVKSCRVDRSASAAGLARAGVVDPVFADIVVRGGLEWQVVGAGDEARLAELVAASPARRRGASAAARKLRAERPAARR